MNGVDAAILVVTTISCLFGLWRGLIKEVLSLVTWIAALLVARVYSETLSEFMVNVIDSSSARYVAAFALIFVVVMMLGTLLNHMLSKLLTITGLKLVDRLLGGVFGVARGVIIVLVILFISSVFVSETEQWQQSTLIPYGLAMIEWSRIFIEDMNSINLGQ
ncbi:MAG TPA: colicin V production CvpA [Gammaproteobacteria bacterium]|jgi:membrane protein required for colicin V production|nr:CvpA family protein [Gammaproteobacteria bacterium]MDP6731757.1 CvpA family protein [Gammaproteobacteria bacterium]HAJ75294.1 colicin V production CvpA [Gammaproteobacteria bacterium]|tara:strand:- start:10 stop:495 length:486 start_codon:yes stop_codon:yes gene_type:complete